VARKKGDGLRPRIVAYATAENEKFVLEFQQQYSMERSAAINAIIERARKSEAETPPLLNAINTVSAKLDEIEKWQKTQAAYLLLIYSHLSGVEPNPLHSAAVMKILE
jgi:hypothetical protein